MNTPTVLLVEDEESFVDALLVGLKREGFKVEVARDGYEALERFDVVRPDIVLLDVMLPRISGIDVCRQLRKRTQVPIIMVTAKSSEIDTVVGLEVGADDYVVRPCRPREVVARVRALARRVRPELAGARATAVRALGPLVVDTGAMRVTVNGAEVKLTATELSLLVELSARPDAVHPRGELLKSVFGLTHEGYARNVDCHVARLRKKLEVAGLEESPIHTVHGIGYRFLVPKGA